LAWAALCGLLRWGVMAQTTELAALALVQPLHGFTFALLHLASMRLITNTVPSVMAGTAQAVYGLVGVGGATAEPFQRADQSNSSLKAHQADRLGTSGSA
jgi:PPP family 3-phenylpropionic acid transporter